MTMQRKLFDATIITAQTRCATEIDIDQSHLAVRYSRQSNRRNCAKLYSIQPLTVDSGQEKRWLSGLLRKLTVPMFGHSEDGNTYADCNPIHPQIMMKNRQI